MRPRVLFLGGKLMKELKINIIFLFLTIGFIFLGCSNPAAPTPKSSTKAITAFIFTTPVATGIITESSHTIAITVPYGTAVTSLTPIIKDTGASLSPASGGEKDFTKQVTYTVTAADSSTTNYTVTVTIAPPGSSGITLTGSLLGDYTVIITLSGTGSIPAPDTTGQYPVFTVSSSANLKITASSTPTAVTYKWILDGVAQQPGSSPSIPLSSLSVQNHYLTLMLTNGIDPFRSATIILAVGN
jgi:hypothetical protein